MTSSTRQPILLFAVLAAVMAVTRLNHFGAVPDASWAVFFVAGFLLQRSLRWAFPALMVVAVVVDYVVISGAGIDFWSHYCVSPGYWLLVPAHLSLWMGGSLLRRFGLPLGGRTAALLPVLVFASVALCHFFAQGGFYWLSDAVPNPTVAGWAKNYADWFLPYLRTTAVYVAIAAVVYLVVRAIAGQPAAQADTALR